MIASTDIVLVLFPPNPQRAPSRLTNRAWECRACSCAVYPSRDGVFTGERPEPLCGRSAKHTCLVSPVPFLRSMFDHELSYPTLTRFVKPCSFARHVLVPRRYKLKTREHPAKVLGVDG